jgi:hypothetical protein
VWASVARYAADGGPSAFRARAWSTPPAGPPLLELYVMLTFFSLS